MKNQTLPSNIFTGEWRGGHIQGIAVDRERKYIYCSFTTELVKLDMQGNLIGSVKGFTGHLGCLAYNEADGRVYGSLEYKNDMIGRSILDKLGLDRVENAFYVAIFDGEKITERDMDAEQGDVMKTVWLKDVVEDYLAEWEEDGATVKHRYGCSGIDGITFAPSFEGEGMRLYVAYGIYSDLNREDNDHQILLCYDPEALKPYEAVLTHQNIHRSGPERAEERYFVFTGNTNFGVQNLEYDPSTGDILMAVYRGKKPQYPNYLLYVVDGGAKPTVQPLKGCKNETGKLLRLKQEGRFHEESGVFGYNTPHGSTGICALGDGLYYFSCPGGENGVHHSVIRLYRRTEDPYRPFVPTAEPNGN